MNDLQTSYIRRVDDLTISLYEFDTIWHDSLHHITVRLLRGPPYTGPHYALLSICLSDHLSVPVHNEKNEELQQTKNWWEGGSWYE